MQKRKQRARTNRMIRSKNKKEYYRWMTRIQRILYIRRFWHCR
jgi:hypothetical protein